MAKQIINIGRTANDRSGDPLRSAFIKINDNFTELYARSENTDSQTLSLVGDTLSISGGNSVTLPTSGSSTGDVTFDGVKVIGAGTASGDGNGFSTLELVPDNSLYANNQYLVIDPTVPSHIHIRAGGTQDASTAELFLGGEKNHVSVVDNSGVFLRNEQASSNTYYYFDPSEFTGGSWFESNGSYYIDFTTTNPGLIATALAFGSSGQDSVEIGDGTNSYILPASGYYGNLGNDTYRLGVSIAPTGGVTFPFTGMIFTVFTTVINDASFANSNFNVSVGGSVELAAGGEVYVAGNTYVSIRNNSLTQPVQIVANNDDTSETWSFNVDGTLTFPDATVQSTAYLGITNTHNGNATLVVGQNVATRGNLSIRLTNNNNTLDVEINYQHPDTTVLVSAYRMYPASVNLYAGRASKESSNTIWDNFGNLAGEGDSLSFTFTDYSLLKVYRVTLIADVMPGVGIAGEAFCTIEELK